MAKKIFVGFDEDNESVFIGPKDREMGMQIVGSPGSGKSKFMEHLMRQDTLAGHGYALIDPHGSCYRPMLRWFTKHDMTHLDAILLNPSEGERLTLFNPLARDEKTGLSVQVDSRIKATLRAWEMDTSKETPTLERWLRVIYWVLLVKNLSINEAYYFVEHSQSKIRKFLSHGISNELIRDELTKLNGYNLKDFDDKLLSTLNKFFRIITAEPISATMGMTDLNLNLDLEDIVENGKILLVNLQPSPFFSKEHSDLLGGLLINQFLELAMKREEGSEPFYLYVDECHRYFSLDFARILEECRKRGLHIIFAHQHMGQAEGEQRVLKSILSAARMKAIFGDLPREDANTFVDECFEINLEEVKKIHYGTKFWPLYKRDKVYARGKSKTKGGGSSSGSGRSMLTGVSVPLYDPTGGMHNLTDGIITQATSQDFEAESDSESEADIPILLPVPYLEKIKEETWTLNEQKQRLSDRLKFQFQRHCFLRFPGKTARAHLVPFVPDYPICDKMLKDFETLLYSKFPQWLPLEEVQKRIELRKQHLLTEAQKFHTITVEPEENTRQKAQPRTRAKAPPKSPKIIPNP